MKKIIPCKFVLGLTIICLILFPLAFYIFAFLAFYLLTFGNSLVPYEVVFVVLGFGIIAEILFLLEPEYCKILIDNGTISNFIFDGTDNDGWCEEISGVKSVVLVGKEEIQKHYSQFNKSKAILIDFGNGNIKYIYAGLFSKKQINQIIQLLTSKK